MASFRDASHSSTDYVNVGTCDHFHWADYPELPSKVFSWSQLNGFTVLRTAPGVKLLYSTRVLRCLLQTTSSGSGNSNRHCSWARVKKSGHSQVVHHGCGGAGSLCFAEEGNGLHQVIHGRARDQRLQGLTLRSRTWPSERCSSSRGTERVCVRESANVRQWGKGYGVDVAPVPLVDQSSGLQRYRLVYQLHIVDKFWQEIKERHQNELF